MRNGLNKLDKYLGERVEITDFHGRTFFLKVTGCGETFISGFDDERMNQRIHMDYVKDIKVVKK